MTIEQERAEFEREFDNYDLERRQYDQNMYQELETQAAWDGWQARAALQSQPLTVDALAQEIRRVDGGHNLGAGALAEALMPFIQKALQSQDREDAFCVWHNDPETDNSWDTGCRKLFEIYDGTPTENGMGFCCYCGKPIREAIDHARRAEGEGNE